MRILIDVNCLADQAEAIIEAANIKLEPNDLCEHGFHRRYLSNAELDAVVDGCVDFWEDMDLLPWAKLLYEYCDDLGPTGFAIPKTRYFSPDVGATCRWLNRHWPVAAPDGTIAGATCLMASSDATLITADPDTAGNFRMQGGRALLLPTSVDTSTGDVGALVETYFADRKI